MIKDLKLTLTGTGTSAGIPMIGCDCDVCTSDDPRDRRDRCGAMIEFIDSSNTQRRILIDAPTELRQQMVRHRVFEIDAVIFTHNHADHVGGIDDLRRFNAVMGRSIPIYGEAYVMDWLANRFDYIFKPHNNINTSFIAQLDQVIIDPEERLNLFGLEIHPIRLMHGNLPILGFRFEDMAYCTDVSHIPDKSMCQLESLETLVIDALRYRPHATHMNVEQAMAVIEQLKPAQAVFTHIAHDIKHSTLQSELPDHIFVGYDGMCFEAPTHSLH